MGALDGLVPLGAGREAEVFLRPDGSVLKLMRSPDHHLRVEREAAALRTLAGPRHLAPRLREVVTVDGRPGLVAERIVGTDLLSLLTGSPWLFLRAATAMATMHAAMHECPAPESLPPLNDELRQRIESAPMLRADLASYALDVLDRLPTGDRLCHGDFHPGNMMGTWETLVAIDWGDASRGDPLADVARTELLNRLAAPPPGTPAPIRALAALGRSLFAGRYLAAYRKARPVDRGELRRWLVVRVAARFIEGIEEEFDTLTAFLEKQHRQR
jgi:aminoglycoside phosphotransferase (APT) family kinase protein